MILFRYISKQILLPFILILIVLLLIMISLSLTKLLSDPLVAIAGFKFLLLSVLYKIPGILYEVMPIAFFLATFMGIGRMYMDIEMHVLFSCGISKKKIFVYTLIPTFIVMLMASVSENVVRPYSANQKTSLKNKINDISLFDYVIEQQFTPIGNTGNVMYVNQIDKKNDVFHDVFIAQLGKQLIRAKTATIERVVQQSAEKTTTQHYLNLQSGILYSNLPGNENYSETHFKHFRLALDQVKKVSSNSKLGKSNKELFASDNVVLHTILVRRLAFPLIFLGFLPWALFLAQTPARKNYYWKILPLVLIYSIHGSGASYIHGQWFSPHLSVWMGKWYWDVILFIMGMIVYFLPDFLRSKKDYHKNTETVL
ncbi:MAG: LptF/LptG family permease [Saccharospirillaceae bacterium]|nr:LptF/LptG family permease [Pseudomonadales bacterium]NRB77876.1 LptF/LptG family permease [Saccharospirillaceae bacterium]